MGWFERLPRPEEISRAFYNHIIKVENTINSPEDDPLAPNRDWCVDRFHTTTNTPGGLKTSHFGVITPGGGYTRARNRIPELETPYEFMQKAVERANGNLVVVVFSRHRNCGKIWVHGAVTPKKQDREDEAAWKIWQADHILMKKLSPADGRRVELRLQERRGLYGSAPVIEPRGKGLFEITNPRYVHQISPEYPLNPDFVGKLIPRQRVLFKEYYLRPTS